MARRHAVVKGERVFAVVDLQVPNAPDAECAIPTNPKRICTLRRSRRSLRLFSGFLPNWQNQEAESEFLNGLPLTLVVVSEWQGKLPPLRWLARARGIVAIFSYITRYS